MRKDKVWLAIHRLLCEHNSFIELIKGSIKLIRLRKHIENNNQEELNRRLLKINQWTEDAESCLAKFYLEMEQQPTKEEIVMELVKEGWLDRGRAETYLNKK